MNKKNQKGFTLTELIVVIVIIAILAAVLIPTLTGTVNKSRKSAASQEGTSTNTTYQAWLVDTDGGYDEKTDMTAYKRLKSFAEYYAIQNQKTAADVNYSSSRQGDVVTAAIAGVTIIYVGTPGENTFTIQATNKYYVKVAKSGETTYTVSDTYTAQDFGQTSVD